MAVPRHACAQVHRPLTPDDACNARCYQVNGAGRPCKSCKQVRAQSARAYDAHSARAWRSRPEHMPRHRRWGECSGGAPQEGLRPAKILSYRVHATIPSYPVVGGGRGSPERSRGGLPAPDSCTPVRSTICPFRADGMLPAILRPTVFAVSPAVLRAEAAPATIRGSKGSIGLLPPPSNPSPLPFGLEAPTVDYK